MPKKKPKLKVMHIVENDRQQQAEETAHKPTMEPGEKKEKPITLTLGEKAGVYFGSREFWVKIFSQFGLQHGKLTVKSLEFEQSANPEEVVAKMVVAKVP